MSTAVSHSPRILAAWLGLGHAAADGSSAFLLGRLGVGDELNAADLGALVLLYNALAFAAQPLVGWLTDLARRPRTATLSGLGLQALAILLLATGGDHSIPAAVPVALAGLGSAFFHVGGSTLAFRSTLGRAAGSGLFTSPGVLGLALGGAAALMGWQASGFFLSAFAILMLGLIVGPLAAKDSVVPSSTPRATESNPHALEAHDWIMAILLAAIALRSLVWTGVNCVLQGRTELLFALAVAAFVGKLAGGFLADWWGWRRWATGSLMGAAVVMAMASSAPLRAQPFLLMVGVALLQSATPAMLASLIQARPRWPATASGLGLGLAIAVGGVPFAPGLDWNVQFSLDWSAAAVLLTLAALAAWSALELSDRAKTSRPRRLPES